MFHVEHVFYVAMKPKIKAKHHAEQMVSPVIDPPVKLGVTLSLKGDLAKGWRRYVVAHQALNPSNGQLVESLIRLGLAKWEGGL